MCVCVCVCVCVCRGGSKSSSDVSLFVQAAVNLNVWITPTEASLNPAGAGLTLFTVKPPKDWTYLDYNGPRYVHPVRTSTMQTVDSRSRSRSCDRLQGSEEGRAPALGA